MRVRIADEIERRERGVARIDAYLFYPDGHQNRPQQIGELRGDLTKYLDAFQLKRPFLNPARPMEMSHLRVIAFVQDDASRDILQAAMVDVKGK